MEQIDLGTLPRTRKEALTLGSEFYYTGPCRNGHTVPRITKSRSCPVCSKNRNAAMTERRRAKKLQEYALVRIVCKQCQQEFAPKYGKGKRKTTAAYCSKTCSDAAYRKMGNTWATRNPEKAAAILLRYRKKVAAEKGKAHRNRMERDRARRLERRHSDPSYRLKCNLRSLFASALRRRGVKKQSRIIDMLGCSIPDFRLHIEAQFKPGMSWDNRSEWHCDHIRPIASFNNPQDPACWHYTNFQPLWAEDNIRKGAKLVA